MGILVTLVILATVVWLMEKLRNRTSRIPEIPPLQEDDMNDDNQYKVTLYSSTGSVISTWTTDKENDLTVEDGNVYFTTSNGKEVQITGNGVVVAEEM